jgi:uncharacterized RDD family membrane protein YckC
MNGTFFCNQCGAPLAADARFCNKCGASTLPAPAIGQTSTPIPAPIVTQDPAAIPPPVVSQVPGSYAAPASVRGYPPPVAHAGFIPVVRYGGFWIRVVATIVDAIVVRVLVAPIGLMFGGMGLLAGMGSGLPRAGFAMLGGGITFVLVIFGQWLYEAFLESSSYQATLGKMIFGMKVTDLNGNRISFARATGRHFAKILSFLVFCIGFIMVGFTERKQGLHDMLAGTLVRRF